MADRYIAHRIYTVRLYVVSTMGRLEKCIAVEVDSPAMSRSEGSFTW